MRLLVTYMELTAKPHENVGSPGANEIAIRRESLSIEDYLSLYNAVGAAVQWDERSRMDQSALAELLADASTTIFVMREYGLAIGLCEFVKSDSPEIELTNFGLAPQVQGRGLGSLLLNHALRHVWAGVTRRVWLHTDTNDHAKAQVVYQKAGFKVIKRQMEDFPD